MGSLIVALCLVTMLVVMLRRPETAEKVDRVFAAAADSEVSTPSPKPLTKGEGLDAATFRKLLDLAEWNAERFAEVPDGQPLTDAERESLLDLLRRLNSIDAADFETESSFNSISTSPNDDRGELVPLSGRVTRIKRRTLPPELAARLEMPSYIECDLALADGGGTATMITARVPTAWFRMRSLDEPAAARGVFVRLLPSTADKPTALVVARDVAWHPRQLREPHVTFRNVVLGTLGMDVGLLDNIVQRRPILPRERDAFYELLAATSRADAQQLLRLANEDLPAVREAWTNVVRELTDKADADRNRLQLAQEVVARADEGRYSVAPLFNDPAGQVGQLLSLAGLARRAIRIDVDADAARRFGIDHYFELDLFTDDSQNNPVVFCVTELPKGFPTGESIREPVRVAGFFFKSWSFDSRRAATQDGEHDVAATRQFAPLLIGRGPVWIQTVPPATNGNVGYLLAAGFLALVAVIWAVGWYFARDERKFADDMLRDRYTLPPGESLNDLDIPLRPDESQGQS